MQRFVEVEQDVRLWVDDDPHRDGTPLLLIMGANASGLTWPGKLVESLGQQHRVILYDHRDTGQSTWAFDVHPYSIVDLAEDAVAVLDALEVTQAHVVGMSMGGTLVQLLLLDHPDRLLSATVLCTSALGTGLAAAGSTPTSDLPGPDPELLALWEEMNQPRNRTNELNWRVEHWRILNGKVVDFDAEEFRKIEEGLIKHAGRHDNPAAHARADQRGLDRGAELAHVTVPTLVIDAPEDPINPPPHAAHLADAIGSACLATIPGMGHALSAPVVERVGEAILSHTARVDRTAVDSPSRGSSAS